jgi:hypothetical protein
MATAFRNGLDIYLRVSLYLMNAEPDEHLLSSAMKTGRRLSGASIEGEANFMTIHHEFGARPFAA